MLKAVALTTLMALLLRQSEADGCPPLACDHCPATVAKVCGVTGMTYDNDCIATCNGEWFTPGECPQTGWNKAAPAGWNWYRGDTLPQYWKTIAGQFGIDYCRLGFKPMEGQWYINEQPVCVGFGEWNHECNYDLYYCLGENQFYGYGVQQMAALEAIIAGNMTAHPLCPACPPPPANHVYTCHDGVKYTYEATPGNANDYGTPGTMAQGGRGTWLTCDCDEIHRGYNVLEGTYWWSLASDAGLDPALLTHYSGVWYYGGNYTCVGRGGFGQSCPELEVVCAGPGGNTYGFGIKQLREVAAAAALPSGEHAYCPLP